MGINAVIVTWNEAQPTHLVSFTKDFYMDATEVTQQEYESLMPKPYYLGISVGPSFPVFNVTWNEAVLYCNKRSKRDGFDTVYIYSSADLSDIKIDLSKSGFRLPNEAEWEYACRAGTKTNAYWPDSDTASKYA